MYWVVQARTRDRVSCCLPPHIPLILLLFLGAESSAMFSPRPLVPLKLKFVCSLDGYVSKSSCEPPLKLCAGRCPR
ncbi:hypothetical protein BZA05DRAFT_380823 [Tricharina praecox]|uniref:uncharacterized protein n=1 Tax=Tricharina praecox TaxID=43433 RepID=UPI00221FF64F|nr:uncharacterized protein BZA05DRAFT_380823 [Tricharina praecox]KAI5858317.1 hypothetical protein BZA05DRAFT_380823 [Tricharina praecox]